MTKLPVLTEMGIVNPTEISRYTLHQVGKVDHLRIIYRRKKNSVLPVSKRFKFGRAEKMVMVDSGTQRTETIQEISPYLTKAIAELDLILKSKRNRKVLVKDIEEEITRIEEEISTHLESLRSMIERLKLS